MNTDYFYHLTALRSLFAVIVTSFGLQASAQELPATQLKVLGGLSTRAMYKDVEVPFWTKTIPNQSAGQIQSEINPFDEMGLKGPELLRLMKQGVIDFGVVPLSYNTSDTPLFEGIDLAGLNTDIGLAKAAAKSFSPVLAKSLATHQQVKLLGVSPYAAQVLFCNVPVRGLSDLKGKTIRTVTRSQSDLLDALGAKSVTIPFAEVLSALAKKKISCAVAGAMTAYTAKWYTATTHIYALPIGWNQEVHAVSQSAWEKIDPKVQVFLTQQTAGLIEKLWDFSTTQSQMGYDCMTGAKACKLKQKGKLILVRPTQQDVNTVKKLAAQKVAPKWATRCSAQCVAEFNQSVGKSLKITLQK